MPSKPAELAGKTFGLLTAVKRTKKRDRDGKILWLCKCKCGGTALVNSHNLAHKRKSCGCAVGQNARCKGDKHPAYKHGASKSREYVSWAHMIDRCLHTTSRSYKACGGKGLVVCARWSDPKTGFGNFMDDMGKCPEDKQVLGRINKARGYNPKNCAWMTYKECINGIVRPNILRLMYKKKLRTVKELAAIAGIPRQKIYDRFRRGVPLTEIMNTPAKGQNKRV